MKVKQNEQDSEPRKKPYQRPAVQVFGDLTNLTQSFGSMGNMDGAGGNPMNTAA